MPEPTVSNNRLHIPLIVVFGAIFTVQGFIFCYFYNWSSIIQAESQQGLAKMQLEIAAFRSGIDLRVSLAEAQLKVTLDSLQEIKSDLRDIKRTVVRP